MFRNILKKAIVVIIPILLDVIVDVIMEYKKKAPILE